MIAEAGLGLPQKLALAFGARQDFLAATGLVEKIEDKRFVASTQVKIARMQVQAGIEPLFPPTYFTFTTVV